MSLARVLLPNERRLAERDHAIYRLVMSQIEPASLDSEREAELVRLGAARIAHVMDLLEQTVILAVAMDRENRAADHHVRACSRCGSPRWLIRFGGVCRGLQLIRHQLDRLHHRYRRAARRLERC
jgi:ribosomal protein S14